MSGNKDVLFAPKEIPGASPKTMAVEWATYLQSGLATDLELDEFRSWFRQSAENSSAFGYVMQSWEDVGLAAMITELTQEAQQQADRNVTAFRLPRRWAVPIGLAAAIILAVGLGFWTPSPPTATRFQYETPVGEIRTVSLEDGSLITLGGSTTLTGQFSGAAREIQMQAGRAYFDIASEVDRPFRVNTGQTIIQVMGTEFDVNFGSDAVTISVEEGRVQVFQNLQNADADSVILHKGEQVETTPSGKPGPVQAYGIDSLSWRSGQLAFIDARLENVIAEVNRYREEKIRIADADLTELRLSFSVPADQTDLLFQGLQASLPVKVEQTPRGVIISKRKTEE